MDFRCSFTTSMQDVAKCEHAETLRLRSDFNDFHVRCFDDFLMFPSIFDAERADKNRKGLGIDFGSIFAPKTMEN